MANEMEDWIDITKETDAKILKRIIRAGEIFYDKDLIKKSDKDLRPCMGDRVKVKLIGKTYDDQHVFMRHEDRPIELNLFTGETIRGLDIAINSMIRSELCEVCIAAEYVNDDLFNEDQIPRNRKLLFTIELIDWENEYLTRKNDGAVIRKVLRPGSGYEVPMLDYMVTINLTGFYLDSTSSSSIVKFDERRAITFPLGEASECSVVSGIEFALYKMKVGEKNRVYIMKQNCFDDNCSIEVFKSTIANNDLNTLPVSYERLIYEVELISFEPTKQVWQMSIDERFALSERKKQRGSQFFKVNKLQISLKCYSQILQAIGPPDTLANSIGELNETQKALRKQLIIDAYNNITLCYLRLNMHKEALKYANWCLELDAENVKAIYRKGLANFGRKEFTQAIELFNQCLQLEPTNKAAQNQITLAQQKIEEYERKEKKIFSSLFQALADDQEIQSMQF